MLLTHNKLYHSEYNSLFGLQSILIRSKYIRDKNLNGKIKYTKFLFNHTIII